MVEAAGQAENGSELQKWAPKSNVDHPDQMRKDGTLPASLYYQHQIFGKLEVLFSHHHPTPRVMGLALQVTLGCA